MLQATFSFFGPNAGTAGEFAYLPLLAGLKEIRLLELQSAGSCQLRYVPWDSAPRYFALSYAWGDPKPVATYIVDGKKILISKSLSAALARIYTYYQNERLYNINENGYRLHVWADAICIDQSNNEEKASQVSLMGEIYKQANRVMVYLGEGTTEKENESVIGVIARSARLYDDYSEANYTQGKVSWKMGCFEKLPSLRGKSLLPFFEQPWWSRVWTLQEVFHTHHAIILYGKHTMEWAKVVKAAHLWRNIDGISTGAGHEEALLASAIYKTGLAAKATLASRDFRLRSSSFSWISLLASTIRFGSTDPRDKLYALVNMSEAIPGFEISYTEPVAEVFKDFTKKYLEHSKDLEILQFAGVNHEGDLMGLPTWVPNFASLNHPILHYHEMLQSDHFASHIKNGFKVWKASSNIIASLQQPTTESEFRPEGLRVGTIEKICGPSNDNSREPGWLDLAYKHFGIEYHPPTMRCHILQAYFRTLFGDRYESENEQLLNFEERFDLAGAFWDMYRKPFAHTFQDMKISGRIDEILLGKRVENWRLQVEPGSRYSSVVLALFSKFTSLYFFVTSNGYMGYGPECKPDDIICILFGCSVPLLLRPQNHGYIIIGQCFVLGVMNGELLNSYGDGSDDKDTKEVFNIL